MFKDMFKAAKKAGGRNTEWGAAKAKRGQKIDLPKVEPTTAEKRQEAKERRERIADAKTAKAKAKHDKKERKRKAKGLKAAKAAAKAAGKKWTSKDAKPWK
jgi:hypothetical protein